MVQKGWPMAKNQTQNQQQKLSRLGEALIQRVQNLPAALSIPEIAAEFKRPADSVRAQIRRGSFPLRVQSCGGDRFVALSDYLKFLEDGEVQTQPAAKRPVGRPSNATKAAARRQGGANA